MKKQGLYMKYFVLNPTKNDVYGDASRYALEAYAYAIQGHNSQLAEELREWKNKCLAKVTKE